LNGSGRVETVPRVEAVPRGPALEALIEPETFVEFAYGGDENVATVEDEVEPVLSGAVVETAPA
jgi:hypothetical protein